MDEQRALLDQLMGKTRDLDDNAKKRYRGVTFHDRDVCKVWQTRALHPCIPRTQSTQCMIAAIICVTATTTLPPPRHAASTNTTNTPLQQCHHPIPYSASSLYTASVPMTTSQAPSPIWAAVLNPYAPRSVMPTISSTSVLCAAVCTQLIFHQNRQT